MEKMSFLFYSAKLNYIIIIIIIIITIKLYDIVAWNLRICYLLNEHAYHMVHSQITYSRPTHILFF